MNIRIASFAIFTASLLHAQASPEDYFTIMVIDDATHRGVPLVELKTTNESAWWTDSNGIIAFNEPGLMGEEVYFHVRSHGYEYPKDGFGNRGLKLRPRKGGSATIRLKRLNIAERLYRVTGQGIYRDSLLVGRPVPLKNPVLDGHVMGQDTVIAMPYKGKIYWFWGDTERVSYPLGNFGASGAVSEFPGRGGLDPNIGVDLKYFVDSSGFSKPMCPGFGPGLQWIEGVMTLPDRDGRPRLVARVSSQKGLTPAYAWHLAVFNDEKKIFESKVKWAVHQGHDSSHPFRATVNGVDYLYLYPNYRVRATLESLSDLKNYEAFTCVAGDGKLAGAETAIDRDASGHVRYAWKAGADRLPASGPRELLDPGKLKPDETWMQLHDSSTGAAVPAGRGSVCWNEFRQRWVLLISSQPGEVWFAEADTSLGPWVYARRVVAHQDYNFYNPTQHSFFDQEGGRLIYFEGTYTASFSGAREKTPRYDYNQIMYRLALDDSRLTLPVPIYQLKAPAARRYLFGEIVRRDGLWNQVEAVAFFALPPNAGLGGLMPIFAAESGRLSSAAPGDGNQPLFFALPPKPAPAARPGIDGTWELKIRNRDGGTFELTVELTVTGETLRANAGEGVTFRRGTFHQDQLEMSLFAEGKLYEFTGSFSDNKLRGEWKRSDGAMAGSWSATRPTDPTGDTNSPAVVALWDYQRDEGERFYSTDSALSGKHTRRTDEPLCRVWRNPMSVLLLDPEAKPARTDH